LKNRIISIVEINIKAKIIQKSYLLPTMGRNLVFIPKIDARRVRGKTITEKIVKSLTTRFVRFDIKESFVSLIAERVSLWFSNIFQTLR